MSVSKMWEAIPKMIVRCSGEDPDAKYEYHKDKEAAEAFRSLLEYMMFRAGRDQRNNFIRTLFGEHEALGTDGIDNEIIRLAMEEVWPRPMQVWRGFRAVSRPGVPETLGWYTTFRDLALWLKTYVMEPDGPVLAADAVVFHPKDPNLLLLILRRWPPYEGKLALPGGHGEYNEEPCAAGLRELLEETSLVGSPNPRLIGVYGKPGRDPRCHVVSTAFLVEVPDVSTLRAGSDAAGAKWVKFDTLSPEDVAFDHYQIILDAKMMLQQ